MNARRWGFRVLVGLLALLFAVYFGVQIFRYFSDPFSTTVVWLYRFEESMELNGSLIRDEEALRTEEGALIRSLREEGERAPVNGTVALIYGEQSALDAQTEADAARRRLEQLRYAKETAAGADTASRMDGEIFETS